MLFRIELNAHLHKSNKRFRIQQMLLIIVVGMTAVSSTFSDDEFDFWRNPIVDIVW